MKAKATSINKGYTPVTLTIELQTQREYDIIHSLFDYRLLTSFMEDDIDHRAIIEILTSCSPQSSTTSDMLDKLHAHMMGETEVRRTFSK